MENFGLMGWALKVRHHQCIYDRHLHSFLQSCLKCLHFFFLPPVQGPRIIRLAAVVDKGFKKGSALDMNVFGTVEKAEF